MRNKKRNQHRMGFFLLIGNLWLAIAPAVAQPIPVVVANKQQSFRKEIPAGNYSGITYWGGHRYAVVNDKAPEEGWYEWILENDSVTGIIKKCEFVGFHPLGKPARDAEDIVIDNNQRLWIVGEGDNKLAAYSLDGVGIYNQDAPFAPYKKLPRNEGIEALTFNRSTDELIVCNETNPIKISFVNKDLEVRSTIDYKTDEPEWNGTHAKVHTNGVPAICDWDNKGLLILEREVLVPKLMMGARVKCKLFFLPYLSITNAKEDAIYNKVLISEWTTKINLTRRSWANYEGMCLGPRLKDGSRLLVLISDSQNRFKGVLKDWVKTMRIK